MSAWLAPGSTSSVPGRRSRARKRRWSATGEQREQRVASRRSDVAPCCPRPLAAICRQRDVLVRRRVGVAGDQAEPRLPTRGPAPLMKASCQMCA
jgi:hypothetical protein